MTFAQAVLAQETVTENGMKAYVSSLNLCNDLFFKIGASRQQSIIPQFVAAYLEDKETAIRIALWARDILEGAGERKVFKEILLYLAYKEHINLLTFEQIVRKSICDGIARWDDFFVFFDDKKFNKETLTFDNYQSIVLNLIQETLTIKQSELYQTRGLLAKWLPRNGFVAAKIRIGLKMQPKQYRKMVVNNTDVVETKMCSKQWDEIDYSKVPSVASARYQKAFNKNDSIRYNEFKSNLKTGVAKINAKAIYPYDVLKSLRNGDKEVALAQWEVLPNYVGDSYILPMVDVSGSMGCPATKTLTCMDIATSLGLYLADKNVGPFKDTFLTFSANPKLEVLHGNLVQKLHQMQAADWGMNTNLEAAFAKVLEVAKTGNVAQQDMPKYILILSDMQFDQCADFSAHEMIKKQYEEIGYEMPNIVFWNLNSQYNNVPVRKDENGTCMVSGFSPAIMKSILKAEEVNPHSIMLETINKDRYKI